MGVRGAALPRGGRRHGGACAGHGGRPAGPEGRARLQRPARPLRTAPSRRVHVPRRRLPRLLRLVRPPVHVRPARRHGDRVLPVARHPPARPPRRLRRHAPAGRGTPVRLQPARRRQGHAHGADRTHGTARQPPVHPPRRGPPRRRVLHPRPRRHARLQGRPHQRGRPVRHVPPARPRRGGPGHARHLHAVRRQLAPSARVRPARPHAGAGAVSEGREGRRQGARHGCGGRRRRLRAARRRPPIAPPPPLPSSHSKAPPGTPHRERT